MTPICPQWADEVPADKQAQFAAALRVAMRDAYESGAKQIAGATAVRRWHRQLFSSLVPISYYAGNFRGIYRDKPCLQAIAWVGSVAGSPPHAVATDFSSVERTYRSYAVDGELNWPSLTPEARVKAFVKTVAEAVGGCIRVHPFMNGNGRTSRLLWLSLAARYGLPPQVRIAPRPDPPYGELMRAAMAGDLRPLQLFILQCLANARLAEPGTT